jgi:hypothetical protein
VGPAQQPAAARLVVAVRLAVAAQQAVVAQPAVAARREAEPRAALPACSAQAVPIAAVPR